MTEKIVRYKDMDIRSKLTVTVENDGIRIIGGRRALKAFAEMISDLADMNPGEHDMPEGTYLHRHLFPGIALTKKSTALELCRKYPKIKNT